MRFATPQGFNSGDQFYCYLKDTFDCLLKEGLAGSPKMMSVGLHCRLVGRPGRAVALQRFLDYVASHGTQACAAAAALLRRTLLTVAAAGVGGSSHRHRAPLEESEPSCSGAMTIHRPVLPSKRERRLLLSTALPK